MHLRDGKLVLSATDVTNHVSCAHRTTLDLAVAEGALAAPADGVDEQLQLVFDRGLDHERGYLEQLREQGRRVKEIPSGLPADQREHLTEQAMRSGADVIYQAVLYDGTWLGYADFLVRNDEVPSRLGSWSYDVADTKLARHLRVPALLQMAGYAERLAELQGVPPQHLVVVTGDRSEHRVRYVDVAAYASGVRERLRRAVEGRTPTASAPTTTCDQCRWVARCAAEWDAADDLSLVAGMRSDHRARLMESGVTTLTALAGARDDDLAVLSPGTRERLRSQARLQLSERETGRPAYQLLSSDPGQGLELLPEPDAADVYLDFEGNPFAEGGSLEYLAGVWTRDGEFVSWWAHDREEERCLTGDLLTWLVRRWQEHPGMHVYHYANYEQAALKRLAQQHATAESELDMLLRGERFVDLYAVVRQGLRLSKGSYSIKKVEDFYWGRTRTGGEGEVTDALSSVVEYERWRAGGRPDDGTLDRLAAYNREDVRSTHDLHRWLEERRAELATVTGRELVRPGDKLPEEAADSASMAAEIALAQRLVDAGQGLLAGCVGWHRREQKSEWWDYYRTQTMSVEELIEDVSTIGGVGQPEDCGKVKRSTVWRYPFPPQDTRIRVGDNLHDAHSHVTVGKVTAIDHEGGWFEVTRGAGRPPERPEAVAANPPLGDTVLRESLLRLGESVLEGRGGTGAGLLERRVPPNLAPKGHETASDVVRRVGVTLTDGQVLAVQGPPGAGKTYTGARLIQDLVEAGLSVGVTAQSHSVIANLVDQVGIRVLRKVSDKPGEQPPDATVRLTDSNDAVLEALTAGEVRLAGGTAWLWAREELAGSVDVLVIDEAGQFSLANALAVAQAARRGIVLLGDPQQLAQPTKADHPHGAGVSALDHLLQGRETIGVDQGVFLDTTWRMHPDVTAFVSTMSYDDRLGSEPRCARQHVEAPGALSGAGLRWIPVQHAGNVSDSPEEARVVAALVADLLRGSWTDFEGRRRPLQPEDILVVAPYNLHVQCLAAAVPEGVSVGTVDKFQGREGAVVIYALGSSSAADAPRGVNFLYDPHRLNVAVSRARALAVVVGSPALLEAPVHTAEQLRAVNALCHFVDLAAEQAERSPACASA